MTDRYLPPLSRRTILYIFWILHELDMHTVKILGGNKQALRAAGTGNHAVIDDGRPLGFQCFIDLLDIVYLKGDVVNPFAVLSEMLCHHIIRVMRFYQLDFRFRIGKNATLISPPPIRISSVFSTRSPKYFVYGSKLFSRFLTATPMCSILTIIAVTPPCFQFHGRFEA